uniref:UspA domain-containing protein n=1 Tax=uncultured microorganism TaxID=358574 RepID=F8UI20_9ZZZZ|nr:UspA domain-containing protein [uncultured microorganism]
MLQRVLVVFENEKVSEKALVYARELALRMDCEVTLLMLVEMPFQNGSHLAPKREAIREIEKRMGKVLAERSAEFLKKGIVVSAALRIGAPAQELMKFLAERHPFQVVIWGGADDFTERGSVPKNHWMNKMAAKLEGSLIIVSHRELKGLESKIGTWSGGDGL